MMCNMPTLFLLIFPRTIIVNHMYTAVKNLVIGNLNSAVVVTAMEFLCVVSFSYTDQIQFQIRRSERFRETGSVKKFTGHYGISEIILEKGRAEELFETLYYCLTS